MKRALSSERGMVDIQSVMVGVIISAVVAGIAIVSMVGFTRMLSDDNSRTTLKTLNLGLETYYTEKDRYPTTLAELADNKYVPQSYKSLPKTELCYVPEVSTYPQTYTATSKSVSSGKFFSVTGEASEPAQAGAYPANPATTCK